MNTRKVFSENGRMYIANRMGCFGKDSEIWEETTDIPKSLNDTIGRGAATIITVNGIEYMLSNTADESLGKWFVKIQSGIHFEKLPKIPDGFEEGLQFLKEKYNLEQRIVVRQHGDYISISIFMEGIDACDYKVKDYNGKKFETSYTELIDFFAQDYDKYACFKTEMESDKFNKNDVKTVDDLKKYNLAGNWEYGGKISEIVYTM